MLYQFRESILRAWEPWREIAGASAVRVAEQPDEAFAGRRQDILANYELMERLTRRYEKPAFGLASTIVDGEPVAVHERTVVQKPFGSVVRFEREFEHADPRLLLIPPMSGHFSTLVRGTVEALLPQHDVFIVDWANARDVPLAAGKFDLDDYIDYVIDIVRLLGPATHVVAVCQAAVPAFAAIAIMEAERDPSPPRTLTLMAGPIDGRRNPTQVNRFAVSQPMDWFERVMVDTAPAGFAGSGRAVYPGFVQLNAFMSMNLDRHVEATLRFWEDVRTGSEAAAEAHRLFYDEYLAVMDLTAEFYLQTVQSVFQDFDLARDRMVSRERPVAPSAIRRTALMTIEGERDDITGIGQTEAAQSLASALPDEMRRHMVQPGVGHFGVFSGRRWRNEIMPNVREFIRSHDRRD